jgi:hypothetical protein
MHSRTRFGKATAIVVATVALTLVVQVAIAKVASPPNTVTANGGLVQTKVARSNDDVTDNTTSWVDVTGMSVSVHAPTKSLILITFTAETSCDSVAGFWCSVRARVGSKSADPDEGTSFAWQNATSANPYEAAAMTRSRIVKAGNYTVKIQMNANGNNMRLDDSSMVVQVIDV